MLVGSTLTMGLIPTRVSFAWWVPLMILGAARIIQGLACGAEMQARTRSYQDKDSTKYVICSTRDFSGK